LNRNNVYIYECKHVYILLSSHENKETEKREARISECTLILTKLPDLGCWYNMAYV